MLVGTIPRYVQGGLPSPRAPRAGRRPQARASQGAGADAGTAGAEETAWGRALGNTLVKQAPVFVIRCRRTQTHVGDLAVRCHKQEMQEEAQCSQRGR